MSLSVGSGDSGAGGTVSLAAGSTTAGDGAGGSVQIAAGTGAAGGDVMDAWSTTMREFKSGSELLASEAAEAIAELHASFQLRHGNGDTAGMLGVDMETF